MEGITLSTVGIGKGVEPLFLPLGNQGRGQGTKVVLDKVDRRSDQYKAGHPFWMILSSKQGEPTPKTGADQNHGAWCEPLDDGLQLLQAPGGAKSTQIIAAMRVVGHIETQPAAPPLGGHLNQGDGLFTLHT